MMDKQTVNGISPKDQEGQRRSPCYSVETPYGFHLDLDFLKYVDDIEKGNTIRRVPMQRRQRGRSSSSLSRNFSVPGYGWRPSQWSSFSTLWPKSQLTESQRCDGGSADYMQPSGPTFKSLTAAEMDASIRAFDEQPLGTHIRPNLLRASSLPLTVLLRKRSESTEDTISPRGSRDYLAQDNGSSEDVFYGPERKACKVNGALQRLTTALERVGELEEEIRVIPELKAQICILEAERERLLLGLRCQTEHTESADSPNGSNSRPNQSENQINYWDSSDQGSKTLENQQETDDDWMIREYDKLERNVKASSMQVDEVDVLSAGEEDPAKRGELQQEEKVILRQKDLSIHAERAQSLTVALEKKVAILEQKLHDLEQELGRSRALLREEKEESRVKDEKLEQLANKSDFWMRAERPTVHPEIVRDKLGTDNSVQTVGTPKSEQRDTGQPSETPSIDARHSGLNMSNPRGANAQETSEFAGDHADMVYHVRRLQELLQEQWEYLSKQGGAGGAPSTEHLPQRVCSIQEQLVTLAKILSLSVTPAQVTMDTKERANNETSDDPSLTESKIKDLIPTAAGIEESKSDGDEDEKNGITSKVQYVFELEDPVDNQSWAILDIGSIEEPEGRSQGGEQSPERAQTSVGSQPHSDSDQVEDPQETNDQHNDVDQPGSQREDQTERTSSVSALELLEDRVTVDSKFMDSCRYLRDHMDKLADPSDEMAQALTVVFQKWFHVTAEADSCSHTVTMYIKDVTSEAPTILQFLVNMVDDNGNTALHYSVSHSNFSIVKTLLDTGVCEVDLQNKAGYTAIMLASLTDAESPVDLSVIQRLMELGDVNALAGQVGQTALHLAVRHGKVCMVRLLLAQGANPNTQDRAGTTPLIIACDRGHTDIVKLLLENADCNVNLTDKGGRSALSLATQASRTEIVDLLNARLETRGPDRCRMS